MEKSNKLFMTILSSIVCLLPIILGLVVYEDLPERMVMQWDLQGNPNWDAPKSFGIFGLPIFLLLVNVFMRFVIGTDPKKKNQSPFVREMFLWMPAMMSLIFNPIMIYSALGVNIPTVKISFLFVGALIVFSGNYMNKNRQNYTIGIRLPWTLDDPENWNKTHRLGGFVWMIGGVLFMILTFLPFNMTVMTNLIYVVLAVICLIPTVYSYMLYKNKQKIKSEE